jgi:hypothetical protein
MKADKYIFNQVEDLNVLREVEGSLLDQDGINAVRLDMGANTITVDYNEKNLNSEKIQKIIAQYGVDIRPMIQD